MIATTTDPQLPEELQKQFPDKLTEAISNLLKNPEYLSMLISGVGTEDRIKIMRWLVKMYQQKKYVKGWMVKKADKYFMDNPYNEVNAKAVSMAIPIAMKSGKFPVEKIKDDEEFYNFLKSLDIMKDSL